MSKRGSGRFIMIFTKGRYAVRVGDELSDGRYGSIVAPPRRSLPITAGLQVPKEIVFVNLGDDIPEADLGHPAYN